MPTAPSYADHRQRAEFVRWLNEVVASSEISKSKLAAALGHDTTQHLNKFLRGQALPMPDTLRTICKQLNRSWPEAFAIAGYYHEIIDALAALYNLASEWCHNDRVHPECGSPEFQAFGVLRIGDLLALDALKDQDLASRYCVGQYVAKPAEIEIDDGVPAHLAAELRADAASPRPIRCIVPRPIAISTLICVTGFPRRGDLFKDSAHDYAGKLFAASGSIIDEAVGTKVQGTKLPALLQIALDILKNTKLAMGTRRIIASELVVEWVNSICQRYTYFARLATFEIWGEAGSAVSTQTAYSSVPQMYLAELPDIEKLPPI